WTSLQLILGLLRILDTGSYKNEDDSVQKPKTEFKELENEHQETSPFVFLYRIKLDIDIEAPLIILPENLLSLSALMLDCGHLNAHTKLQIDKNYFISEKYQPDENKLNHVCKLPPVMEIQDIVLVDCSQFKLTITRNLQPLIYSNIEVINVKAEYGGLIASLARSDYSFAIQLLQNFTEKTNQSQDIDIPELPITRESNSQNKQQFVHAPEMSILKSTNVLKISVNLVIESIQMNLHNESLSQINNKRCVRPKENAFSNLELKNLNFEMNSYEDTENERDSVKVMFFLDTIILDDTTQVKSGKKPIRLIEKYSSKKSTLGPMILIEYEQKTVRPDDEEETQIHFIPEKNIKLHFSFMRVCLNVDYLLTLYEFFIEGIPKKNESITDRIDLELSEEQSFNMNQRLFCEINVENPQFIFYEDQNEFTKSNSFIIDALIKLNFSMMNQKTKISLSIDDLMFRLRCYVMKKILTRKTYVLLSPTTVSFSGVIEESEEYKSAEDLEKRNQLFILDVQNINLNLSPQMLSTFIKMLNSIQNSMNKKFKIDSTEVREETKVKFESLFQTIAFQPKDFWFTQRKEENFSLSRSSSLVSSQSGFSVSSSDQSASKKNQMIISTKNILVKLESGLSDQQPLLCLNIAANGEFSNWTHKPYLSMNIVCQMAYFNESLSVWEPVIELVEFKPDHLKPFEVSIQMITNIQSEQSLKPKKEKNRHFTNLKPIRTFQVNSTIPLQFVVTKTFLSMLDTLSRTFVLSSELIEKKSQQHLEYFSFDQEEEYLLEKLENKLKTEENFDNDLNEDSPSFDFLIKNDLGFDVVLKAIKGFKFQNIDSIDPMKHKALLIDKINLKNNSVCPINLEYNFMYSFESGTKLLEEPEKIRNTIKFSLEIENNEWEPVVITLDKSAVNGFNLNNKNSDKSDLNDKIIICETVTKLDKKRIYLRSPVQDYGLINQRFFIFLFTFLRFLILFSLSLIFIRFFTFRTSVCHFLFSSKMLLSNCPVITKQ
ncbi:vacuolar sorting-associated 13C isoform X2, partial [Brachionus plicatilis]